MAKADAKYAHFKSYAFFQAYRFKLIFPARAVRTVICTLKKAPRLNQVFSGPIGFLKNWVLLAYARSALNSPEEWRKISITKKMVPIRASVTHIDLKDSGLSWIEVEIDVPSRCERIELNLERLGPTAYAPPLLNSPEGLRKIWITNEGPPTITVGETIWASSFTKGEDSSK